MAPPSDHSTTCTTLLKIKDVTNELGFMYIPNCFDMGLLNKALEITWSQNDIDGMILCEGGMHILMSYIAGIGNIYRDCGLKNLFHKSGVSLHDQ